MTFEEQIQKLVERHEELARTVELLAEENRQMAEENQQRDRRMGEIMEALGRLVHVAEIQEERIEDRAS